MPDALRTILKTGLSGEVRVAALTAMFPAWRHWTDRLVSDPSMIVAAPVDIAAEYVASCAATASLDIVAAADRRRAVQHAVDVRRARDREALHAAAPVVKAHSARLRGLLARDVADVAAEFHAGKLTTSMAWQWLQALEPADRQIAYRRLPALDTLASSDDIALRASMIALVATGDVPDVTVRSVVTSCGNRAPAVAQMLAATFNGTINAELYNAMKLLCDSSQRSQPLTTLAGRALAGLVAVDVAATPAIRTHRHCAAMLFLHAAGCLDTATAWSITLPRDEDLPALLAAVGCPVAEIIVERVIAETGYLWLSDQTIRAALIAHPDMTSATKTLALGRLDVPTVAAVLAGTDRTLPRVSVGERDAVLRSLVAGRPSGLSDLCGRLGAIGADRLLDDLIRGCPTLAARALSGVLGVEADRSVVRVLSERLGEDRAAWECIVSLADGWSGSVDELADAALLLAGVDRPATGG